MPINIFQAEGIDPKKQSPVNIFKQEGITISPEDQEEDLPTYGEQHPIAYGLKSLGAGASDAVTNLSRGLLNKIPGVNIQPRTYDQYQQAAEQEQAATEEFRKNNPGLSLLQMKGSANQQSSPINPATVSFDELSQYGPPQRSLYKLGKFAGNVLPYMGVGAAAGAALKALGAAGEAAPLLSKGAQLLLENPTIARILGNTAYGGLTDPNMKRGAITQGLTSAALEGVPALAKGIYKGSSYIRPGMIVEDIKNILSRENISGLKETGNDLYNSISSKVGNVKLYDKLPIPSSPSTELSLGPGKGLSTDLGGGTVPSGTRDLMKESDYFKIPQKQRDKIFTTDTKLLEKNFLEDPSLENARKLDSQFGSIIRKFNSKEKKDVILSAGDEARRHSYQFAQSSLRNDINRLLDHVDPTGGLNQQMQAAHQYWASSVVPAKMASSAIQSLPKDATPSQINARLMQVEKKSSYTNEDKGIYRPGIPQAVLDKLGNLRERQSRLDTLRESIPFGISRSLSTISSKLYPMIEKQLMLKGKPIYQHFLKPAILANRLNQQREKTEE